MQEDHVSMGWAAARKLRRAIDGLTQVLAIELLTAARGTELRAPLAPAPATHAVITALRDEVPGPGPDRFLAPEIGAAAAFIASGAAAGAAQPVTGMLA
jgi:histidine ammonia-lyase